MSKHETLNPVKEKEKVANPRFQQVIKNARQYALEREARKHGQGRIKRALRVAWEEFRINHQKNNTVYWEHFTSFLERKYKLISEYSDCENIYYFHDEDLKLIFLLKYYR